MLIADAVHVLFIDGYHAEREYYAERLEAISPQYVVHRASSGQAGLTQFQSASIDCVILEIDLPDMSGFAVLVRLVPGVRHPEVPVIVLSRVSNEALLEMAVRNGAQAALQKGMTSGDLLEKAIWKAIAVVRREKARPLSA